MYTDEDWRVWKKESELSEVSQSFFGESSAGAGYVKDFSLGLTSEDFIKELNALLSSDDKYLDYTTSALIISFNCYEPSLDLFLVVRMHFDFSLAGIVIPKQIKIICFALDQIKQVSPDALIIDSL